MKKVIAIMLCIVLLCVSVVRVSIKGAGEYEFDPTELYIGDYVDNWTDETGYRGIIIDVTSSSDPDALAYMLYVPAEQIHEPFEYSPFYWDFTIGKWRNLNGYGYTYIPGEDYSIGYQDGFDVGRDYGYGVGYDAGHDVGVVDGFDDGYSVGLIDGALQGYDDAYADGYSAGVRTLDFYDKMLYQNVVLPNGVKDEIIDNEVLVDCVGVAVFDGSEDWVRYDYDVEPYTTVAFKLSSFPAAFSPARTHFISNFLIAGSVWGNDVANRIDVTGASVLVRLLKSDLIVHGYDDSMTDVQKVGVFKSWLSAQKTAGNPLTVWYEYAASKQYDVRVVLSTAGDDYYKAGFAAGRVAGFGAGKAETVDVDWLKQIFVSFDSFLGIRVFGNITIGNIIFVPLIFGVLLWILKLVRG